MGRKWWKKHKKHIQQQKQIQQEKKPVAPVSTSTYWQPEKACHDGVIDVFEFEQVTFWGGKAKEIMRYNDWDLMLCFSDKAMGWESNEPAPLITANRGARDILDPELFVQSQYAPWIGIDWPDYDVPDLDRKWWLRLLDNILELPKPANIAMGCTGGHGRTGTALSIFLALCNNDLVDPVPIVRKHYCYKAVETQRQCKYITDITGAEVKSIPTWAPVTRQPAGNLDKAYYSQYEIGGKDKDNEVKSESALDKEIEAAVRQELGLDPKPASQGLAQGYWLQKPVTNAAGDIIKWDRVWVEYQPAYDPDSDVKI